MRNHGLNPIFGFRARPVGMLCNLYAREDGEGDGTPPAGDPPKDVPAGLLTQAQVDAAITARLSRERQAQAAQLAQLGIGGEGQPKTIEEFVAQQETERQRSLAEQGRFKELYESTQAQLKRAEDERAAIAAAQAESVRENAITSALNAEVARSVAPSQVAVLLRQSLRYEATSGEVYVADAQGNRMVDAVGNPYSVKALVDGFLRENPHFQPPSGAGAGGATPPPATPAGVPGNASNGKPNLADPKTREEAWAALGLNPQSIMNSGGIYRPLNNPK